VGVLHGAGSTAMAAEMAHTWGEGEEAMAEAGKWLGRWSGTRRVRGARRTGQRRHARAVLASSGSSGNGGAFRKQRQGVR